MSREQLTTERIRKFARRAQGYLCAYYRLHHGNESEIQSEQISPQTIEKLVCDFKTHRCALDFENKFIVKTKSDAPESSVLDSGAVVCTASSPVTK